MKTQQQNTQTPSIKPNFKQSLLQAALTMSLIIPSLANANEVNQSVDSRSMETMVITANRTPQNLSSVLNSVEILTREDISASPAQSVAEILNSVNGIQLSQSGGAGQAASVFSRGTDSGHTLVIIDGQRVSSATLGQVPFAELSLDQIERIEVIKGPRAALWGSDAIGGVIQIFTRQLNAGELTARASLGNDGQQQSNLSTAFAHGNGSTTVTLAAKSADGYDVLETAESDDDGYSRENISIVGTQHLNQYWRLKWLGKYNQGVTESDNAYGGANKASFETYQLQMTTTQSQGDFFQELVLGKERNESNSYGNGISEDDGTTYETTRLQASWLGSYQILDSLSSTLGLDYNNEKVHTSAENSYVKDERDNYAVFARTAYNHDGFILDASIRYDDIEDVDTETSYNLSIGQEFSDNSLVSLNYGTGFKAPSFNDLYYPLDSWGYQGNDQLSSETSKSLELLVKHDFGLFTSEMSLYKTKIDDLIEWVTYPDWSSSPENIAKSTIKGAEITLNATLLNMDHEIQWGYLDAKNDDTDERLIRRAKNTASYQVAKQWDKVSVMANVNYQGKRLDSQWPGTTTLPSHTIVNFSSSYQLNKHWQLGFKMNNVFDKDYVSINNYKGQPQLYLLSVSYNH